MAKILYPFLIFVTGCVGFPQPKFVERIYSDPKRATISYEPPSYADQTSEQRAEIDRMIKSYCGGKSKLLREYVTNTYAGSSATQIGSVVVSSPEYEDTRFMEFECASLQIDEDI